MQPCQISGMSSLPCSAVAASASHILVDQCFRLSLLQQRGCCWQSSMQRAWGPGQQDTVWLETVDAAWKWVMLCSTYRFAALSSLGLQEAGCLCLAARGALHRCLLKLLGRVDFREMFQREGSSFQPYFLLLMMVIAESHLRRNIYTTHILFTCGHSS